MTDADTFQLPRLPVANNNLNQLHSEFKENSQRIHREVAEKLQRSCREVAEKLQRFNLKVRAVQIWTKIRVL